MPTFIRKPPADLKCSSCGCTTVPLVECVACLRESSRGDALPIYCSGPKGGCFNAHWQTRKHGPNGSCDVAKGSAAPSPQLRPPSAARSVRGLADSSSNCGSGSSSPGPGSLSSSPSVAAPITPPPPPRKGFAHHRHYSPHAAAIHAGGLRPLHATSTQRAVSAGGPSSRDG